MVSLSAKVEELARVIRKRERVGASSRRFVVNPQSQVCHRTWICDLNTPISTWRARCGWKFGSATFSLAERLPLCHTRCTRCFHSTEGNDDSDSSNAPVGEDID
eukprot:2102474-Amphidinium_carterae.1